MRSKSRVSWDSDSICLELEDEGQIEFFGEYQYLFNKSHVLHRQSELTVADHQRSIPHHWDMRRMADFYRLTARHLNKFRVLFLLHVSGHLELGLLFG